MMDPRPLLRQVTLQDSNPVLSQFETLRGASECPEQVLYKLAFQKKAGMSLDRSLLDEWFTSFDKLRSKCSLRSWLALKGACGMSLFQIESLYSKDETVCDN